MEHPGATNRYPGATIRHFVRPMDIKGRPMEHPRATSQHMGRPMNIGGDQSTFEGEQSIPGEPLIVNFPEVVAAGRNKRT